jgi:hypothetical protein
MTVSKYGIDFGDYPTGRRQTKAFLNSDHYQGCSKHTAAVNSPMSVEDGLAAPYFLAYLPHG